MSTVQSTGSRGDPDLSPVGDAGQVRAQPWSVGAIVLRVGAVAALLMASGATWLGGAPPTLLLVLGVVTLGGIAGLRPESPAGSIALLFVLWWWTVVDLEAWHVAALIALPCLVAAHIMLTMAALTPPVMPLDPSVTRLWARRGATLSVAAEIVLAVAWLSSRGGTDWAIVAVGLLAVLGTVIVLTVRYPRQESTS